VLPSGKDSVPSALKTITQIMNTTTNFAATIGLDWADQKHDLWIRPADGSKAEHVRLEQTPEAVHEWVAKARERFDNRKIAIAVETSRGPVISALMAYDFIVLFPVNPKGLKSYRGAFSISGSVSLSVQMRAFDHGVGRSSLSRFQR